MTQLSSCYECGFKYSRRQTRYCPRCGEEKIYTPSLHDPNYDIAKDPVALLKYRVIGITILLAVFVFTMNITH
jgi:hypothetical protein